MVLSIWLVSLINDQKRSDHRNRQHPLTIPPLIEKHTSTNIYTDASKLGDVLHIKEVSSVDFRKRWTMAKDIEATFRPCSPHRSWRWKQMKCCTVNFGGFNMANMWFFVYLVSFSLVLCNVLVNKNEIAWWSSCNDV